MCVNVNEYPASKILWQMLIKINGEMELKHFLVSW